MNFIFLFLDGRRSWKSLPVDIQEAEERGLELQKEIFNGISVRRKRRSGIKISGALISLEGWWEHFFSGLKRKRSKDA